MTKLDRRRFLQGFAASAAVMGLPGRWAHALQSRSDLKFLFVFAPGGWDPTTVFAPLFGNPNVDLEPDAAQAVIGGIPLVDHANRPSVRAFFESWASSSLVLNGVNVRSLSHDICTMRMLTGGTRNAAPDWPTRLADARASDFTLPHLNLSGPAMPGDRGDAFASAGFNGQLQGLLNGSILDDSDQDTTLSSGRNRPDPVASRAVDAYLKRRMNARVMSSSEGAESELVQGLRASLDRAADLKSRRFEMDFTPGFSLDEQAATAVQALGLGISRCVSVGHPVSWDTHANNGTQSLLFNDLFRSLRTIMDLLGATTSTSGAVLRDETVLVVLSEMGRTPRLNANQGKDHWPYTSVLITGPCVTGGRTVGGYDSLYYGRGVDPVSAEIDDASPLISTEVLGATLLAMADIDPGDALPGVEPLYGVLG